MTLIQQFARRTERSHLSEYTTEMAKLIENGTLTELGSGYMKRVTGTDEQFVVAWSARGDWQGYKKDFGGGNYLLDYCLLLDDDLAPWIFSESLPLSDQTYKSAKEQ